MKQVFCAGGLALVLSGCAGVGDFLKPQVAPEVPGATDAVPLAPPVNEAVLAPATAAPPPPPAARTPEALDTTTPKQRAAAAAPAPADVQSKGLGKTVVSLGSPAEPGLWLKTPLVSAEAQGRVTNPANGKSSMVTLLPLEAPATAGSRMSLAAMRVIEAPLTDLTEVEVAIEG